MPSLQLHQEKDKHLLISNPINSIEELHNWHANTATDISNIANIKLQQRQKNTGSKLLVCHDMAGGYKEDNWVQGKGIESIYSINYWQFIDSFVYFSHSRVSIPPVVWTNACHRNGVLSLGTFLVEGDDGTVELERLFYGYKSDEKSDDPMQLWSPHYADKLVELTKFYGFDGWLFNIESNFTEFPIPPQFKAEQLSEFLGYFQKKLHNEVPGSKVIWYDSLTKEGKVDWQDQLNNENKMFFEKSDGIFLNYWWKEDYPEKAKEITEKLGRSEQDVYFGVDVWGRKTFGGGKFNSYKGVEAAKKHGLSSALFAPAWTYEHFGAEKFKKMDRKFWLGDHDHPGVADTIRPAPEKSWFSTFFDCGFGSAYYFNGKKLLNQTWSHLSHQSISPSYSNVKLDNNDAYIGGTSVILYNDNKYTAFYKLSLEMKDEFQLQYVYKPLVADRNDFIIKCQLLMEIINTENTTTDLPFIIKFKEDSIDSKYISISKSNSSLLSSSTTTTALNNGWIMKTIQFKNDSPDNSTLIIKELGFTVKDRNRNLGIYNHRLNEVYRLGLINITSNNNNNNNMDLIKTTTTIKMNKIEPFEWNDVHWETLENDNNNNEEKEKRKKHRFWGTLNWKQVDDDDDNNNNSETWNQIYFIMISIMNNNQHDDVFLGTSFSSQFRISGLDLSDDNYFTGLLIQPVNFLGQIQNNNTVPFPNYPTF